VPASMVGEVQAVALPRHPRHDVADPIPRQLSKQRWRSSSSGSPGSKGQEAEGGGERVAAIG
jgi:hypothetical protein